MAWKIKRFTLEIAGDSQNQRTSIDGAANQ
jgi:hypothetical protein